MHGAEKAYGIYKVHVYLLIKKNDNWKFELLPVFYLGLPHMHVVRVAEGIMGQR